MARTSATCESIEPGSPGPFASSTPSGASASTCAAVASWGSTVTVAPALSSSRTIEALAP